MHLQSRFTAGDVTTASDVLSFSTEAGSLLLEEKGVYH